MLNREPIYSKFPKVKLGIGMVETFYNRQIEPSVPEQISRPLATFTFLSTNIDLLVKKKSWPNF